MGDSTCLNAVSTTVKGFIIEGQAGTEYGQLLLNFMPLSVDVVVLYDFYMGGSVIQLVGGFGKGVELVPG